VEAMNRSLIYGTILAISFLSHNATAGSVSFDTTSYSFKLAGGGGGGTATVDGVEVNIFGDDFANKVAFPHDYSANVTTLSTDANLSETRFGQVASNAWTTVNLTGHSKIVNQDRTFFNHGAGSSALARYEMAAYLVSLYNVGQGNNVSNNQIQEAIWTLLDPSKSGKAPNPRNSNPTNYLEQAADWFSSMNSPGSQDDLNEFLDDFEIVSPTSMKYKKGLGSGGFQEQIAMLPVTPPINLSLRNEIVLASTPEPRAVSLIVILLFVSGGFLSRRARQMKASAMQSSTVLPATTA
jgi:hypothetical protein